MRLVFLDSGPLGLLTSPRGRPRADGCRQWAQDLLAAGVRVLVSEVADYEVRRELIRIGALEVLDRRLDVGLGLARVTEHDEGAGLDTQLLRQLDRALDLLDGHAPVHGVQDLL